MTLAPITFKGCALSSKIVLGAMSVVAILISISIYRTHHWVLHSVPSYVTGVGWMDWFNFAVWGYIVWISAEFFRTAKCKSDRVFFGLFISLCLLEFLRSLAIFADIRSAMLSVNELHPAILYAIGIIRWIIGIAMYAVVLDHLFRSYKTQLTEVQA